MPLSVTKSAHRHHINRARLELVKPLRSIEEAGNTLTENNFRATESLVVADVVFYGEAIERIVYSEMRRGGPVPEVGRGRR